MAEGVGFEPTKGVNPCRFSRPVHSTALPPLRKKTVFLYNDRMLIIDDSALL